MFWLAGVMPLLRSWRLMDDGRSCKYFAPLELRRGGASENYSR